MSMSGYEAWRESLMGNQNGMMIQTMELVNRASTHSGVAMVKGDIGSREPHGLQGSLQEVHLLLEKTAWMDRVNKVCGIHTR